MLTKAVARFVRVSPRKARLLADLIRGKRVGEALSLLQYSPHAAARLLEKVLRSAIANAEHNHQVRDVDSLQVGVVVDGGPSLKRIQPRAMGRAYRILHRTSHLTVSLAEAEAIAMRRTAAAAEAGRTGRGRRGGGAGAKTTRSA
jgi:large subunit ribosomal protein L22